MAAAATVKANLLASRLVRAHSRLRDRYSDMTILQAMIYFAVAAEPGVVPRDLLVPLATSDGVLSRNLAILSDVGFRNTEPMNLIELRPHPTDRRMKNLYLTAKGQRLLEDIEADVTGRHK